MDSERTSTRTVARIFLTVLALSAAVYALYLVRNVLVLTATAIFVAVALGPAVDALNRRRLPRAASILAVYLALVASIFGIGLLFVPPLVSGVQSIADDAPTYLQKLRTDKTFRGYDNRYHITRRLEGQAARLPAKLGRAASTLSSVTVGVFSTVVQLVTVLTMAFFLLLDGRRMVAWLVGVLPPDRQQRAAVLTSAVYRSVAGYVAGNLAISFIAGLVSYVTLTILNVPFALPLAVLMAFFDLIPLVGATIGAVIVGLVTLFHGFPTSTIVWFVVQIAYQQIESNVLVPIIYRRTVAVNGLVTIIAVLIGASLLGVLGALVAIPIAGAVQLVVQDVWAARQARLQREIVNPDAAFAPPG
jgi:predicted PurR-regulated permease PerM